MPLIKKRRYFFGLLILLLAADARGQVETKIRPEREDSIEVDLWTQKDFPTIVTTSVLSPKGLSIDQPNGLPVFNNVSILNLPLTDTHGKAVDFENSKHIVAIFKNSEKILVKEYLKPSMSGQSNTMLVNNPHFEMVKPLQPPGTGSYIAQIYIDGHIIFSMPVELKVVYAENHDAPIKECRTIDGLWSKFGYLSFTSKDVLIWNFYETNRDTKVKVSVRDGRVYSVSQQLFKDGKPFSAKMTDDHLTMRGDWSIFHTTFTTLTGDSLVKKTFLPDGEYLIKVGVEDEQREYPFQVREGNIVLAEEQDKSKTRSAAKRLVGMENEYWVRRAK